MKKKYKVLLDTDIGDDIDDALTLALALKMPEVDLVGITTVYKDTDLRAREAKRMLKLAGLDIPVYAGMPGEHGCSRDGFSQYEPELEKPEYAPLNDMKKDGGLAAVHFIGDCAERYGANLIIVGVGPMTNLATAVKLYPDAMRRVGKISLMCGAFYRTANEWNVLCDVHAADTVLSAPLHTECYGLDVTMKLMLSGWQYNRLIHYSGSDSLLRYTAELARMWHDSTGGLPTLHDPLTLYNAVRPGVVFLEKQNIQVVTEGEFKGVTLNRDNTLICCQEQAELHRIAVGKAVSEQEFFKDYFKTLFWEEV